MSPQFMATIYGFLAQLVAVVLLPGSFRTPFLYRGLFVWALTLFFVMMVPDNLFVLVAVGVLLILLAPSAADRVPFFLLVVPCVPVYIAPQVPFPGLNYLISLNNMKLASLVLLLPILIFRRKSSTRTSGWFVADFIVVAFVIFTALITLFRTQTTESSVTGAFRDVADQALLLAIPYFAIQFVVTTREDMDRCFRAILIASVFLACIAIFSVAKDWDFYRYNEPSSAFKVLDYRYGIQRMSVTANTHSLGYLCGLAVVIVMYLRAIGQIGKVRSLALAAVLITGMLVTVSRGAFVGTVGAMLLYYALSRKKVSHRYLLLLASGVGGTAFALYMLSGQTASLDPFASVEYRRLLLERSLMFISDHYWLGDSNFLADPLFLPLVQGQGIVDITNMYLQVLLNHGIAGLVLVFGPFIFLSFGYIKSSLRKPKYAELGSSRFHTDSQRALLLALPAGWFVLISTTSDVALTAYIGVILLSLQRAGYGSLAIEPNSVRRRRVEPPSIPDRARVSSQALQAR